MSGRFIFSFKVVMASAILFSMSLSMTVILNTGRVITGSIVEFEESVLTVETATGIEEIPKEYIKRTELSDSEKEFKPKITLMYLKLNISDGLGEPIDTHLQVISNDMKVNRFINAQLVFGRQLYDDWTGEVGAGLIFRGHNIMDTQNGAYFRTVYASASLLNEFFRSLKGGYRFYAGFGVDYYADPTLWVIENGGDTHEVHYKNTMGYHAFLCTRANLPPFLFIRDWQFFMNFNWLFGHQFAFDHRLTNGVRFSNSLNADWNQLDGSSVLFEAGLGIRF